MSLIFVRYCSTIKRFHSYQRALPEVSIPVVTKRYNIIQSLNVPRIFTQKLSIILLCNSFNGLSKSVYASLMDDGHSITKIVENPSSQDMIEALREPHDIILAPFLTKRIPRELYERETPCLVVHPGILGDRGASSLDWAISQGLPTWGVTVLSASDVMDGGDVWSTSRFSVPDDITKASLYRQHITSNAVACVRSALNKFLSKEAPTAPDYGSPQVTGDLMRNMKRKDRAINWSGETTPQIIRKVQMSDSSPGASATLNGNHSVLIYGARPFLGDLASFSVKPGTIIGRSKYNHLLIKSKDGALWISHAKDPSQKLKLPSALLLSPHLLTDIKLYRGPTDIWAELGEGEHSDVCFIYFPCYNGAISTEQCVRLRDLLQTVASNQSVRVVCLMGGPDFYSNGIHLNMIEASAEPAQESWENINAINDVVREVFRMEKKLTVSVLQGSAGAGGAMMALASDQVVAHRGVTLSPSYQPMGLTGSEYWTYFLPQRVGGKYEAEKIEASTLPISAKAACKLGMVDKVIGRDRSGLISGLSEELSLLKSKKLKETLQIKSYRSSRWYREVERARHLELIQMKDCFQSSLYQAKRKEFVYH